MTEGGTPFSVEQQGPITTTRKKVMLTTDTKAVVALDGRLTSEDVFALDVRVVTDSRTAGDVAVPCNTDDGCAATCASSCASNM